MKKLNRKGFTLVELLAVIIILAIVVGIAIPSVTSVINNSKKKGIETAVNAAGGYLEKQAQLMNVDAGSVDSEFTAALANVNTAYTYNIDTDTGAKKTTGLNLWKKLGLKTTNITEIQVKYTANGTVCLKVTKIPKASEYFTVGDWTVSGNYATAKSSVDVEYGSAC